MFSMSVALVTKVLPMCLIVQFFGEKVTFSLNVIENNIELCGNVSLAQNILATCITTLCNKL